MDQSEIPVDPPYPAGPPPHDDIPVDVDQEASAHVDLYALDHDSIADPPRSLALAFRQIGPGLILAGSIVGTGELINTTGLGAKVGYTMLWLILLSCVIKVFVQIELGRYAITHGKTSLTAFNSLPGPRLGASWLCWLWLFMMLTTQAQIAAMEGLVGQAAHQAMPGVSRAFAQTVGIVYGPWGEYLGQRPEYVWAVVTGLAAIALLLSGGYRRLETITTLLVAVVTLFTVACVIGLAWTPYPVHWDELAGGLDFALPAAGIALAFSAFGITGVGASELFAYPYWCIEKGYARAVGPRSEDPAWAERARGWMRVMRLDAWFSMIVFTIATIAFYILGAAVLHPQKIEPQGAGMLRELAAMYVPVLGGWTSTLFLLGAWAVLFKTLYVATAANSRLTADFLRLAGLKSAEGPKGRERLVRVFCVIYPLTALTLYLIFREPKTLVTVGGIAQALMLPVVAGATIYLGRRDRDPRVAAGRVSEVLVWVAFVSISAVALYSVTTLIRSALG